MRKFLAVISFILLFAMLFVACDEFKNGDKGKGDGGKEQGGSESGGENQGASEPYTEGLLFTELPDGTYEVSRGTATAAEHIVIPSTYNGKTVTAIAREGFNESREFETDANVIKTVTLPSSITKIGQAAFGYCMKLESINIPSSVTEIEKWAFTNCQELQSIVIPSGIKVIGETTFMWCQSLKTVEIPSSVEAIESKAFYGCSLLESVIIGNGVTSIGKSAFFDCDLLASIKYRGTEAQWNAISKGQKWDTGFDGKLNYTLVCNYTGE